MEMEDKEEQNEEKAKVQIIQNVKTANQHEALLDKVLRKMAKCNPSFQCGADARGRRSSNSGDDCFRLRSEVTANQHQTHEKFDRSLRFRFELRMSDYTDSEPGFKVLSPEHSCPEELETSWRVKVYPAGRTADTRNWIKISLGCTGLHPRYYGMVYMRETMTQLPDRRGSHGNKDDVGAERESFKNEISTVLRPGKYFGAPFFLKKSSVADRLVLQIHVRWCALPTALLRKPSCLYYQNGRTEVRLQVKWRIKDWANGSGGHGSEICSHIFGRQGVLWSLLFNPNGHPTAAPDTITAGIGLLLLPAALREHCGASLNHVQLRLQVGDVVRSEQFLQLGEAAVAGWNFGNRAEFLHKYKTLELRADLSYQYFEVELSGDKEDNSVKERREEETDVTEDLLQDVQNGNDLAGLQSRQRSANGFGFGSFRRMLNRVWTGHRVK